MNKTLIEEKIKWSLTFLSENSLKDLKIYIDQVIEEKKNHSPRIAKLKGIWKDNGFEKMNIENEIPLLRKELSSELEKRIQKWNI
jgi:hypothetical protein